MTHRLVYRSAPLLPPEACILDIARAAERRNARLGCSGLLFYGPGTYAQVIEGPEAAVAEIWGQIAGDRRHRVLWRRAAPVRARAVGPDLPMGYLSEREARGEPACAALLDLLSGDMSAAPAAPDRAPGLGRALAEAARRKYPAGCTGRAG